MGKEKRPKSIRDDEELEKYLTYLNSLREFLIYWRKTLSRLTFI